MQFRQQLKVALVPVLLKLAVHGHPGLALPGPQANQQQMHRALGNTARSDKQTTRMRV